MNTIVKNNTEDKTSGDSQAKLEIKSSTGSPRAKLARGIQKLRNAGSFLAPAVFIYGGLAVSLLGILPVLSVIGVIGNGRVEPLGVLFGILFGVIFGGGGGLALYIGLSNAMDARLGRSNPFFIRLLQLVWVRANRKTLYAATPDLLLALMILWVIADTNSLPWLQRNDLRYLVVLEFFAIHSTVFLGIIAFARWTGWGGLALVPQAILFLGFLGLYIFGAYQAAGLIGAIGFGVLTLSKYVSYAVRPLSLESKGKLALRWFTGLVIFITVGMSFGMELEAQDNLVFAVTYFVILAIFEAFDLMAPSTDDSAKVSTKDSASQV